MCVFVGVVEKYSALEKLSCAAADIEPWRTHALVERAETSLLKVCDADADAGDITPLQVATVSVNLCSAYRLLSDTERRFSGSYATMP